MFNREFTQSCLISVLDMYAGMDPGKKAEFRKKVSRYHADTAQKRRGKAAFMYLLEQADSNNTETE